MDTVPPTVSGISLSATGADINGHLNAGDVVTAVVSFSKAVMVTGTPQLELQVGADTVLATYQSGAGTDSLVFTYTIQGSQSAPNGIALPADALQLNGGTVHDAAGNQANVTTQAIADNAQFIVDNSPLELTLSAGDVFGSVTADAFQAGETPATSFLAQVVGHTPSDVTLHLTTSLTVAQATELVKLGFNLLSNATYTIRDYDTAVQAAMLDPTTAAVMRGADQVTAIGDELANAMRFTSFDSLVNLRIESGAGNDTVDTGQGGAQIVGGSGADTINLTYNNTAADTVIYQTIYDGKTQPVVEVAFSTSAADYREGSVLSVQVTTKTYVTVNGKEQVQTQTYTDTYTVQPGDTPADALQALANQIKADVGVQDVIVRDNNVLEIQGATCSLTSNGVSYEKLAVLSVSAPNAIVNPGEKTIWDVQLPTDPNAYPTDTSALGTFNFDRQVHVTIAGVDVNASVAYSAGVADPVATLANLQSAVQAQMAVGQPLHDVLGSVDIVNGALVLTGLTAPQTDVAAPTFTVSGASIDVAGVQQQTAVSFSNSNADYYQGGTLSVDVGGQHIVANMVAGSASQSLAALQAAVEAQIGGGGSLTGTLEGVNVVSQTTGSPSYVGAFDYQWIGGGATRTYHTADISNAVSQYGSFTVLDAALNGNVFTSSAHYTSLADWAVDAQAYWRLTDSSATVSYDAQTGVLTITTQAYVGQVGIPVLEFQQSTSELVFTAATEAPDPLHVTGQESYAGAAQHAIIDLTHATSYTTLSDGHTVPVNPAAVYFDGGQAHVTITGAGADGVLGTGDDVTVTVDAAMGADEAGTAANLAAAINAQTATGGSLDGVIGAATVNPNGTIDLAGAQVGQQSFSIGGVRLDYAGVHEQATVSLDGSATYTTSSVGNGIHSDVHPAVYYQGGQAHVTITGAGADGMLGTGDDVTVTIDAAMGTDAASTAANLASAINAQTGAQGSLFDIISSASANGGALTLDAAAVGPNSFAVSATSLDYQGYQQIATADFGSTSNADYYAGGQMHLTVTPTNGAPVEITSDMVAGSKADSLAALQAAVQQHIGIGGDLAGIVGTATFSTVAGALDHTDRTNSNYIAPPGGGADLGEKYVFATDLSTAEWIDIKSSTPNQPGGYFRASGTGAVLWDGGSLTGAPFRTIGDWVNAFNAQHGSVLTASYDPSTNALSIERIPSAVSGFSGIIGTMQLNDYLAVPGNALTFTSAANEAQQFSVSAAGIDVYHPYYAGAQQDVSVTFESNDAYYYNGGQISLTLHGRTFTQDMLPAAGQLSAAQATVLALQQQIVAAFSETLNSAPTDYANWLTANLGTSDHVVITGGGTAIDFTAKDASASNPIDVSAGTMSVVPVTQVTTLDLSNVQFDHRVDSTGHGAQVHVTIAGTTITADVGATDADTLQNIYNAIVAARDGVNGAGYDPSVHANLGTVDLTNGVLTLTASHAGPDPLQVNWASESDVGGTPNVVLLSLDNLRFDDPSQVPDGSTIHVQVGGATVDVTIPNTTGDGALRSEHITSLIASALASAGGHIAAVEQGYVGLDGNFVPLSSGSTGANVLEITANEHGANVLGTPDNGGIVVTVTNGATNVPLAITASTYQTGTIVYDWNTPVDGVTATAGRDAGTATVDSSNTETATVHGVAVDSGVPSLVYSSSSGADPVAAYTDQSSQTVTNPTDNASFYGDAASAGAGAGVAQSYTNPDSGAVHHDGSAQAATTGNGDPTLQGDSALSGGGGVAQTFSNPDGGITGSASTPDTHGTTAAGNASLYGSNPGTYVDNGLLSTYVSGATPAQSNVDGQGGNLYTSQGATDLAAVVGVDASVSSGHDASTSSLGNGALTDVQNGFAPFTWDGAVLHVDSTGNVAPDVVNNFQTAYDHISLEGSLASSTFVGDITATDASVSYVPTTITVHGSSADNISISRGTTAVFDFGNIDLSAPFTVNTANYNHILFNLLDSPTSWTRQGEYTLTQTTFANVNDFVNNLFASNHWATGTLNPTWSVHGGVLTFTAPDGYAFATDQVYNLTSTGSVAQIGQFDLTRDEFGLVHSAHSTVDASSLGDAAAIAALLNSDFQFGATTNDGSSHTSVFAVTAADDPTVTAIWAHRQSTAGDSTVSAGELTQLALVHTLGNEFDWQNFAQAQHQVMPT